MKIKYILNSKIQKLGWLAYINLRDQDIIIEHGKYVEINDNWIVEGVWDGPFNKGNFHKSNFFFGSGIRVEGNKIFIIPSTAVTDRIVYCMNDKNLIVSNSMLLLLATTNAKLDADHNYVSESFCILDGIKNYDKTFRVIHPKVGCFYQIFNENMIVSGKDIFFKKKFSDKKFESYNQYHHQLKTILDKIFFNFTDQNRNFNITAHTTISKGYDSTAVSCLVKDYNIKCAFTGKSPIDPFRQVIKKIINYKFSTDDGTKAAKFLGLNVRYLDLNSSNISEDELYFLSTNYPKDASVKDRKSRFDGNKYRRITHWAETSHHSMAKYVDKNETVSVIFTGYHGDIIWEKNISEKYLTNDIIRKGVAGLNLTEIRLKSGFINIAVPFILANNIEQINKISNSDEMQLWSLKSNDYNRPIPRKIAEDLGINRQLFGTQKKYIAKQYILPYNKSLRADFIRHLQENKKINKLWIHAFTGYTSFIYYLKQIFNTLLKTNFKFRMNFLESFDLFFLMNHWAIDTLKNKLRRNLVLKNGEIFKKED